MGIRDYRRVVARWKVKNDCPKFEDSVEKINATKPHIASIHEKNRNKRGGG